MYAHITILEEYSYVSKKQQQQKENFYLVAISSSTLHAAMAAAVGVARRVAGGGGAEVGGAWGTGAACVRRAAALFLGALGLGAAAAVICGRDFPLQWRDGRQRCVDACPRRYEEGVSGGRPRSGVPGATARVWRDRWRDCAGASSGGEAD
jgi:hypothetical protein